MSSLKRRNIRHKRIRKKIRGTKERPRLSIFISNRNIYLQLINDEEGKTIVSAATIEKELNEKVKGLKMQNKAEEVGKILAERAIQLGINKVVFDRGGYKFHNRLRVVAEAIKAKGISC